jgi:WD40 repeat protein/serine/threonine protein kinase
MPGEHSGDYALLDRLAEEFAARYRRGERPSLEEYTAKYPRLAADIREIFPAMVAIEQVEQDLLEPPGAAEAAPLERVGDYRILREVGRGGMGVVYEAEQLSLGRRVALKVLPLHGARDGKSLERFRREARAAARLHHTNIVPVFEVGQAGDICYYAMQFIQGQGLDQIVEEVRRLRENKSAPARPVPLHNPALTGTKGEGADAVFSVSLAAACLLSGRLHPGDHEAPTLVPQLAGSAVPAGGRTEDYASPAVGRDVPLTPPPSSASSSAVLRGQTGLSSAGSQRPQYYRSVARAGQQVAAALAYAHARGIIHRDIKPSNLLLDAAGVVWVTDFGLAKTEDDGLTNPGDIVGTLRYLAPERFQGKCDARADVYALGLSLYELLVLQPAFAAEDRLRLIDQIKHAAPARPRALEPRIPRDLETIVLKAMDKDPGRRYPSANDLAEDLRRFLDDVPIRARPVGRGEKLWRWCRRNPVVASLTAAVLLFFAAGFAGVTWNYWQAEAARRQLESNLYVQSIALAHRELSADNLGRAEEYLKECPAGLRQWEWHYLKRLCRVEPTLLSGSAKEVYGAAFSPDGGRLAFAHGDGTVGLFDVETGERFQTLHGHTKVVFSVAFHPEGRRLASASADGTVRVWDLTTDKEIHTHPGQARGGGASFVGSGGVAFSPDGHRLAAAGPDDSLMVWDVDGGQEIFRLRPHEGIASAVAFSPDGLLLASGSGGGSLRIWDARTGQLLHEVPAHNAVITAVAFRPRSRCVATAGYDRTVKFWDVTTGKCLRTLPGQSRTVFGLAFTPDGRRLAACGEDTIVKLLDADTNKELLSLQGHTFFCLGVTFSPDGRRLASAGLDGTVRIWDASPLTGSEGAESLTLGHDGEVWSVAFSPDGRQIASGGHDGTVRLWNGTSGASIRTFTDLDKVFQVSFSPDGKYLASSAAGADGTVMKAWDVTTLQEVPSNPPGGLRPFCVTFSPDGLYLLADSTDNVIKVWEARTGREERPLGQDIHGTMGLAFSPDGRRLAAASLDWKVRVWEWDPTRMGKVKEPEFIREVRVLGFSNRVAFYPDSRRLVTGGEEQSVKVWDLNTGQEIRTLRGHTGEVQCVAVSPDGRWIASAGQDSTVRLWDAKTWEPLHKLRGHTGVVSSLAFSPDSRRLVSGSRDHTAKVWDLTRLDKKLKE